MLRMLGEGLSSMWTNESPSPVGFVDGSRKQSAELAHETEWP